MKYTTSLRALLGFSIALAVAPAFAAPTQTTPPPAPVTVPSLPVAGEFSISPSVGTAFNVSGDFVKSGSDSVSNTSIFGAAVTGTTVFSVSSKDFNDAYDLPINVGIAGNYGLTNQDEVSLGLRWMHAESKSFDALDVTSAGTINGHAFAGNASFQGQFNNYNEFGLEGGYKHFFDVSHTDFHPYLGGLIGAKYNDSVKLDLSYNGTPIINGMRFYDSGFSWSAGLLAGFRYDVATSVAFGLETGIRYEGDLKQNTADINTASAGGVASVNGGGSRWDIPVMIGLTAKF